MKRCLPSLSNNEAEANGNLTENNIQIPTDPSNPSDFEDVTFEQINSGLGGIISSEAEDFFRTTVADLQNTWPMILIVLGMALVVSFIWIVLMRWIAAPLIWVLKFLTDFFIEFRAFTLELSIEQSLQFSVIGFILLIAGFILGLIRLMALNGETNQADFNNNLEQLYLGYLIMFVGILITTLIGFGGMFKRTISSFTSSQD